MSWTEDRVAILKKLWLEGHSASQIANELGGVTRNAVIGKVHRLGLSGRATPSRPVKRPPKLARPKPSPAAKTAQPPSRAPSSKTAAVAATITPEGPKLAPKPPKILEHGKPAGVLDLKEGMCRWPVGDPASPDFCFCGHETEEGSVYCKEHAAAAFQPASNRRSKNDADRALLRRLG